MDDPQVKNAGLGALQLMLFEEVAEHLLWHPTFIIDYRWKCRHWRAHPTPVERFATGRKSPTAFRVERPEDPSRTYRGDAGDGESVFYDADLSAHSSDRRRVAAGSGLTI